MIRPKCCYRIDKQHSDSQLFLTWHYHLYSVCPDFCCSHRICLTCVTVLTRTVNTGNDCTIVMVCGYIKWLEHTCGWHDKWCLTPGQPSSEWLPGFWLYWPPAVTLWMDLSEEVSVWRASCPQMDLGPWSWTAPQILPHPDPETSKEKVFRELVHTCSVEANMTCFH